MESTNQVQLVQDVSAFSAPAQFEHAQRVAKMLSSSDLVPDVYRGNIQNTLIALEAANRIGASPLMVMQNLYIVHGRPSWSSSFIIAAINSSKKFSPLRFKVEGEGDAFGCIAWALEIGTDERLQSPRVTLGMAKAEGWVAKKGSKWATMPELMLMYRAASFFGRLYAPEVLMGMHSMEEIQDAQVISTTPPATPSKAKKTNKEDERLFLLIDDAETLDQLTTLKAHIDPTNEGLIEAYFSKLSTLTN